MNKIYKVVHISPQHALKLLLITTFWSKVHEGITQLENRTST